jgi:hypothetical protein
LHTKDKRATVIFSAQLFAKNSAVTAVSPPKMDAAFLSHFFTVMAAANGDFCAL